MCATDYVEADADEAVLVERDDDDCQSVSTITAIQTDCEPDSDNDRDLDGNVPFSDCIPPRKLTTGFLSLTECIVLIFC